MELCKASVIIPSRRIPQLTQLRIELYPLHDIAPAASSANRLHGELKEGTTGRATSQLFPPVKRSVQQGVLSVFFITEVIQDFVRHGGGDKFEFSRARHRLLQTGKHVISHDRQEMGGRDSGEGQMRGLIDRRKIRGGPPMGTRFPSPVLFLDRAL